MATSIENRNYMNKCQCAKFKRGERIFGLFYNSWDKQHHLAEYVPWRDPPREFLCKAPGPHSAAGGFAGSGRADKDKLCKKCFKLFKKEDGRRKVPWSCC